MKKTITIGVLSLLVLVLALSLAMQKKAQDMIEDELQQDIESAQFMITTILDDLVVGDLWTAWRFCETILDGRDGYDTPSLGFFAVARGSSSWIQYVFFLERHTEKEIYPTEVVEATIEFYGALDDWDRALGHAIEQDRSVLFQQEHLDIFEELSGPLARLRTHYSKLDEEQKEWYLGELMELTELLKEQSLLLKPIE